jgi:hypothetical protein
MLGRRRRLATREREEIDMKRAVIAACVCLGVLALAAPLFAQSGEIALTRQVIQTERQALVTAAMELTEQEGAAFWPLYREYRGAMAKVGDRGQALIIDYAAKYAMLTDADAQVMLDEMLAIDQETLKVKKDYVKKFGKILPAKRVARFFQIENKMDAIIRADLAEQIPLAR